LSPATGSRSFRPEKKIEKILILYCPFSPARSTYLMNITKNDGGEEMTPLRVLRKPMPLVMAIRLSLLPLAGLAAAPVFAAAQYDIAAGELDTP
jgi:hypothetical protein